MTTIEIIQRTVCNRILYYPACDKAQTFAKLIKRKTLHKAELSLIKKLGFEVEVTKES